MTEGREDYLINLLKQSIETPFMEAVYFKDMDCLEFQTEDCLIITERIDEWFDVFRKNGTDEIVGFRVNCPLEFAKRLIK